MIGENLVNVRHTHPLIHNITNYVTVNDVANVLLATGASPIMADDMEEMDDIVSICQALVINTGTLNQRTIASMLYAGKKSNELQHVTVLDPVGVGASRLRSRTAEAFVQEVRFDAIKGNISEIKSLFLGTNSTSGVDANSVDSVTEENKIEMATIIKKIAQEMQTIIIATGAIDIVADANKAYLITNGRPEMSYVTGTGCQLGALVTAFITANQDNALEAAAEAVMMMGIAGELAWSSQAGNITYRNHMIDEIFKMTPETITQYANYEVI
ncbi:hydroxyethylthiazole kinase [Granulicatella balaenopterae]|uniref:Hydroxyethylthiazole kinase n=1 Tax=Granulicatella balaenopterae TaxID=137733 RepID=A0A1H9KYK7_9LACT|nr:hydroxyethylthiazole kinase [Granulicatella balaenopterae]SER04158.1 hydroxyethylthiazole kinase [Granulicatella balaenopterae]